MNYITFDIETYIPEDLKKTQSSSSGRLDTSIMKVSVIGAYFSWIDKYLVFYEGDVEDFIGALQLADYVIGYNHIWFDLPVLQKYTKFNLNTLPNYDLMLEAQKKIGYKIKLDNLAQNNLTFKKTESYANYKDYYQNGKFFELTDYCMHDVLITEQLFRMALAQSSVKYNDMLNVREIVLDLPSPISRSSTNLNDHLFN